MTIQSQRLQDLLHQHLRPRVKEIDEQGKYPGDFLKLLGEEGFYSQSPSDNLKVIRDVATVCVSTAFVVWCQTAAISFVSNGTSDELKQELLSSLLTGEVFGGTGISNAMKFYAGLEELKLVGEKTPTGYCLHGTLPFVSNLAPHSWFAVVFRTGDNQRAIALVPTDCEGVNLKEVNGFLGLNGTATYSCQFQNVHLSQKYVVSEQADELIAKIRPGFLLTQVGLALGVTRASLDSMNNLQDKQKAVNQFLKVQPTSLENRLQQLTDRVEQLSDRSAIATVSFREVVEARLESAYLALDAAQAEMLHAGAAGYVAGSHTSRRLRESLFLAVVTPAVKQLEIMLKSLS